MIEELTPRLLGVALLLVIVVAPVLALLLSALLLARYRRQVTRAMAATGGFQGAETEAPTAELPPPQTRKVDDRSQASNRQDAYHRAVSAPWHNAIRAALCPPVRQ